MFDLETQVLIIGGGATGTGLARDLALRGVQCILVEKDELNAGASGGNHGLLHSGARYVSNDPVSAEECRLEANLLKQLAPQCIEETGGLFVAVEGDDENYIADFPLFCSKCGIPIREISRDEAFEREPGISEKLIAAYLTEDGAIDPFKLSLENMAQAQSLGCSCLQHTKVIGFEVRKNRIEAVHVLDAESGQQKRIKIDQVVNASGVWAAEIAALANIPINMLIPKGVFSLRLTGYHTG
jgi:glycerol-3-phosphate dehydrogenase